MKEQENPESGFTLIETLVAFVILSSAVIVALSAMSENLRLMQQAARIVEARKVAQQALTTYLGQDQSKRASLAGQQGKFKWRIATTHLSKTVESLIAPALVTVSVTEVAGQAIAQATLQTIVMVRTQ